MNDEEKTVIDDIDSDSDTISEKNITIDDSQNGNLEEDVIDPAAIAIKESLEEKTVDDEVISAEDMDEQSDSDIGISRGKKTSFVERLKGMLSFSKAGKKSTKKKKRKKSSKPEMPIRFRVRLAFIYAGFLSAIIFQFGIIILLDYYKIEPWLRKSVMSAGPLYIMAVSLWLFISHQKELKEYKEFGDVSSKQSVQNHSSFQQEDLSSTVDLLVEQKLDDYRSELLGRKIKFSTLLMNIRTLVSSTDKDEIFRAISDVLKKSLDVTESAIYIRTATGSFVAVHSTGKPLEDFPDFSIEDDHLLAFIASRGGRISRNEAELDPVLAGMAKKCKASMLYAIALEIEREVIGLINIGELSEDKAELTEEEMNLLSTCATVSSVSLKNADMLSSTREDLLSETKLSPQEKEEKLRIKEMFGRNASPEVITRLLASPESLKLDGEEVEATLMFADIIGFSQFCENSPPETVVAVLNEYLSAMNQIIMNYQGTLDKFIGDGIVALWNVPERQTGHELRAISAAWMMMKKVQEMEEYFKRTGSPALKIGIGINTGRIIVGNIGSEMQMSFTAIGDEVNVASKLQNLTRHYDAPIVISEQTWKAAESMIEARPVGTVKLKGGKADSVVYGVYDVRLDG